MAARNENLSKVELEVEQNVLSTKVKLSDGSTGHIFSRNPSRNDARLFTYNCHICSVPNLPGERCLYTHISGRRHQQRLATQPFNANLFRAPLHRSNKIVMEIAPGEPVPPGFENEVKAVAEIQSKIDKCKSTPFIGLEYLLELRLSDDKEPGYLCVLCEKRGDPRTIMDHITSYKHRLKYLEKHFPTVTREINTYRYRGDGRDVLPHIIQKVCEAIEDAYGRLTPSAYDNDEYEKNRMSCLQEIINDKHLSEKNGSTFINVINKKEIDEWITKSKAKFLTSAKRSASPTESQASKRGRLTSTERRRSLDSISSISDSSLDRAADKDDDVIFIRSNSRSNSPRNNIKRRRSRSKSHDFSARNRSRSPRSRTKSPGRQKLPTPRELAAQANAIGDEKYKWEKYRCLVDVALKELEKKREEYEKSPEKHPLYPDEWKIFWNRRYKELQAEKVNPATYDLIPEWKEFWTKRMRELHDESVEKKKDEIRKRLNLPKDGRERTSELKEKYAIKASARKDRPDASPTKIVPSKITSASTSSSSSMRRDKLERSYRYDRSRSREKIYRPSYERGKSAERYEHIERDRRGRDDERDKQRDRDRERERDIERLRERDRERDRHRSTSRGSFHEDSPIHHYGRSDERETAGYYPAPPNPYKWHANQPKSHYLSKSHYYGRDMPASGGQKYDDPPENEEPENIDEPLTVVTVLRLLSALEELLGPSLGPKIVELLAKALALEKVKANSADDLLLNEENCVLFETIKEKLKAQLMTDMVEKNRMKAVKRAIKNIAGVIHLANEREKNKTPEEKQQDALLKKTLAVEKQPTSTGSAVAAAPELKSPEEEKKEIAKKLAAALVAQGKTNVSTEELETLVNYYYEQRKAKESAAQVSSAEPTASASTAAAPKSPSSASNKAEASQSNASPVRSDIDESAIDLTDEINESKREHDDEFDLPQDTSHALESLTDADLQTLLQNFEDLSNEEQQHLHTYMKKLEASNPSRVEKLRKFVNVAFDLDRSGSNDRNDKNRGISPERYENTKRMMDSRSQQRARHQNDPYSDMFYDDTKDMGSTAAAAAAATIVDSDDDDYSYDDLCKAASKNVKDHQLELESRQKSPDALSDGGDSMNRHDQFILGGERNNHYDDCDGRLTAFLGNSKSSISNHVNNDDLSNASRASGGENANSRPALNDTESIIANLMGSLKNNVQSRNLSDRSLSSGSGGDPLNNDGQIQRNQIQKNVPFYMQQQQQQQQQQSQNTYATANTNSMYANELQGQNVPYATTQNQYDNSGYGNQNSNYAQQRITNNIPLNIPSYAQQHQIQPQNTLTNQQAALLAQLSQQQNRRQAW